MTPGPEPLALAPIAVLASVTLRAGGRVSPARGHVLYVTESGVVHEETSGDTPPEVYGWDEVANVSVAARGGTLAIDVARALETGEPFDPPSTRARRGRKRRPKDEASGAAEGEET